MLNVETIAATLAAEQAAKRAALVARPEPTPYVGDSAALMDRASAYLARMDEAISGQGGHDALYAAALAMVRGFGLSDADALRLLRSEYNGRCLPPWDDADLARKVSEARKADRLPGADGYLRDAPPPERPRAERHDPDEPPPEAMAGDDCAELCGVSRGPDPDRMFERGDQAELADRVLERLSIDQDRLVCDLGAIHTCDRDTGVWRPSTLDTLRRIGKSFAGLDRYVGIGPQGETKTTPLKVSSGATEGAIKLAMAQVAQPGFFDGAPPGVAFTNGFVTVENGEIKVLPHSPEHRCRHAHAFAYDARADHRALDGFLAEVFGDAGPCEAQARISLLQEFTGACLVGLAPVYQRCLVLLGPGGNGKSQAIRIMRGALPDGTIASLPPQLWSERFQVSRLLGCTANLCDELPGRDFLESGAFKSIITGEPTHVERKYLDAFDAAIRCGHAFSANALPVTADLSEAFFRRFLVVRFSRQFSGTGDDRPDVGAAVVAACRPGIAAWAIEGAARLQRQGGYTLPASCTDTIGKWRQEADSVATFVGESCDRLPLATAAEQGTPARRLYAEYRSWAEANGMRPVNSTNFGKRMGAIGLGSIHVASGRYHLVRQRCGQG